MPRQLMEGSYERLCSHHNKPVEKLLCECGRMVSINIIERHQQTGIHKKLIDFKNRCAKKCEDKKERINVINGLLEKIQKSEEKILKSKEQLINEMKQLTEGSTLEPTLNECIS